MSEFSDTIERLFTAEVTPQQVRAIEHGAASDELWEKICESGFTDALIPESMGGAGLGLSDVFDVVAACGGHCLPLPLSLTMLARAALAEARHELPEGAITIAVGPFKQGDALACDRVPYALSSSWVLIALDGGCALMPIDKAHIEPTGVHGSLEGNLRFQASSANAVKFAFRLDWRSACAGLIAAQMAGAMDRVFADTVRFANERSQFGKSIGKFQAIQQQISMMAEQVFAARMAAQLGCAGAGYRLDPLMAAMAKARVSEAVTSVTAVAHAVHGAMGITEEYDLQLFTRRLHEWRLAFGSESFWNEQIGQSLLESRARGTVDFIRARLSPALN